MIETEKTFREDAEKHWQFIKKLLTTYRGSVELNGVKPETVSLDCCHYLYVEAMVHGHKHTLASFNQIPMAVKKEGENKPE